MPERNGTEKTAMYRSCFPPGKIAVENLFKISIIEL